MGSLKSDLTLAFRSLRRSPLFTLVAVLSLALGIGANTAIFSLIDQALLRGLPVKDADRLVQVYTQGPHYGASRGSRTLSYPMYKDFRDKNQVFTGILCSRTAMVNMSYEGPAERVEMEGVSGNYFEVLGVGAAIGRVFGREDETIPDANPVVVLSHSYWQSRFRAAPDIIGRTIRVNGFPMTVVGVAAPGYEGLNPAFRPKLYVPVTMKKQITPAWDDLENRRSRWLYALARLKPGVSIPQAEASLRTLHKQIISEEVKDPWFNRVYEFARKDFLRSYAVVLPGGQGYSGLRRGMETPLTVLAGLVGLVLLIACANVSNLLVARATGRRKELAVRLALGAGRWRIVRQLFVESLVLALAGGALAPVIAYWSNRAILPLAPTEQIRGAFTLAPDLHTLFFAFGASLVAALLFGLLPSIQMSRADLITAIKEQAGSILGGHGVGTRKALVAAQVTLALVLLVGSGLFVQSLRNMRLVDPGFRVTNLIRFAVNPALSGYNAERIHAFYAQAQQRLEALPGVESASLAAVGVLEGDDWTQTITIEGYQAKENENTEPYFNSIAPRYFKTLGMGLKEGRDFDERDHIRAPKVAIVNETFVRRYFGGRSPLGFHIGMGRGPNVKLDHEIVGVVADAKYEQLREETPCQVFVCSAQAASPTSRVFYVRSLLETSRTFTAVRNEMRNLDADVPLFDLLTMEDQLDRSLSLERLVTYLSTAYGLLASLLAVMGLYGVTAYGVARRAREIGIRMALGAESADVVRMVLREVLVLASIGIAVALPASWWLTQLVRSQLFGIEPHNPTTILAAALALLAVAALAGVAPALRASRVNPVTVLRYE